MKWHAGFALMLTLAPYSAWADQATDATADQLFRFGKFAEAAAQYRQVAEQNPSDYHATLQVGRIALLANRYADAEMWLQKANALKPDETDPRITLAEVYYRQDEFDKAATALDGIDNLSTNPLITTEYATLNVAKLQSFRGRTPYQVQGGGSINRIKLLQIEPLPLVTVRVNGGREVTFFIDTGGSEVVLDSDFAKELGTPDFGSVQGVFSGGQQAPVTQTRIDSLTIGSWVINNLPAAALPLRQLSEGIGGGRTINGIIGTTLFYHFLTTLDYPNSELVMRKKSKSYRLPKGATFPFWMAGDHFMVAWGQIESQPPSLIFLDTGLTGAGVKLGETMLKNANIQLEYDKQETGAGGAGTLTIVPYTVQSAVFGKVHETNVPGVYDGPFPQEYAFGFYLAGMVGGTFGLPYAITFDFDKMEVSFAGGQPQAQH
jgi:Aspartyl protease/Tetratricopeptide repeat